MLKIVGRALSTPVCLCRKSFVFLLFSIVLAPASFADSDLEEVVVSLPLKSKAKDVATGVTVLTGKELRQQLATTLGETLSQQPGISSASFGTGVGQPVIRGQQGARVTVLRNGTSVADASNLSVDHAIVVEPAQAQSVEVLRGPASLLYGGGAIGGIVNVIDERIPKSAAVESGLSAEVRHGSVNDETVSVMHGTHVTDNFGFHIDGVYRESNETEISGEAVAGDVRTEGRLLNSAARASNYAFGASHFLENGFVGFSYERSENLYGIPPSDEQLDEGELIDLDVEQNRYELRGEHRFSDKTLESMRWQLTYSDYEHIEVASGEAGTIFSNENIESRLELIHAIDEGWRGAAGLQLRSRNFSAAGDEAFVPRVDIASVGLFLLEQTTVANATIELGLRYDYDSVETDEVVDGVLGADETFNSLNLSASSLWQLNDEWSTAVALSYAERGLAVEEIYSNPSCDPDPDELVVHEATEAIEKGIVCNGGDPEKEQSSNIDFTLRFGGENLESWVTVFYNDFSDFVYLRNTGVTSSEGVPVFDYTQADADFYGIELESSLSLQTSDGMAHTLTFWGDIIRGQLSQGNEDLPRLPARRTGLRWNGEINSFSMYSSITLADSQSRPGADEDPTSHYTRWDAGLEYEFEKSDVDYAAFLRLKNLTDEEIRYATSFRREVEPQAGRSIEVGIRLSL